VTKPGQLLSIDVWTCEVPYRWGGQQKVLLIHDHYSTRDFVYLLSSEAECAAQLKEFFALCRVDGVSPVHVHGDNAKVFTEKGVHVETCRRVCNEMKPPVHFTTSCEYVPRQNGVCERRWGIHRADCCRQMFHAGANANLWWDCFRHSADIEAMLPIDGHPDECGYSRWHNGLKKPRFAALARPWGCLCYAKYPVTGGGKRVDNMSKVAPQAARCMHLGRSEGKPGWKCYEVSTGRVFDTPNVDFVETCFPGITVGKGGVEQIVPPFAQDYDPNAKAAPGRSAVDSWARVQPPQQQQQQTAPEQKPAPTNPISQRLSRNRGPPAAMAKEVLAATDAAELSDKAAHVVPAGVEMQYHARDLKFRRAARQIRAVLVLGKQASWRPKRPAGQERPGMRHGRRQHRQEPARLDSRGRCRGALRRRCRRQQLRLRHGVLPVLDMFGGALRARGAASGA